MTYYLRGLLLLLSEGVKFCSGTVPFCIEQLATIYSSWQAGLFSSGGEGAGWAPSVCLPPFGKRKGVDIFRKGDEFAKEELDLKGFLSGFFFGGWDRHHFPLTNEMEGNRL